MIACYPLDVQQPPHPLFSSFNAMIRDKFEKELRSLKSNILLCSFVHKSLKFVTSVDINSCHFLVWLLYFEPDNII